MKEAGMIPREAVEAAERAIQKEMESQAYDRHAYTQVALEAAAPFLRAQALEDAADVLHAQAANLAAFYRDKEMNETAKASHDAISHDARMLRARAATERGQG